MANSFGSLTTLDVGKRKFEIHKLSALEKAGLKPGRLPFSLRILLENLLRHEDGKQVKEADIRALAALGRQGRARRARSRSCPRGVLLAGLHGRARGGRPGGHARRR